jgi:phosphohistidine phosphatase
MAVELYIVRHAIAAERGPDWPDDAKRPLTDRGIDRFREVVAALAGLDVRLESVLTSPLVRAKQTAELLAKGIASEPELAIVPALAPGHTPGEAMEDVARKAGGAACVAVVGHEPDLGRLAAHLIGARRAVPFKKGGVCRIDMDTLSSRGGRLVWFAPPRVLRKLGK